MSISKIKSMITNVELPLFTKSIADMCNDDYCNGNINICLDDSDKPNLRSNIWKAQSIILFRGNINQVFELIKSSVTDDKHYKICVKIYDNESLDISKLADLTESISQKYPNSEVINAISFDLGN